MDSNIETCKKRNNHRPSPISESIIEECFIKVQPPTYIEGWDLIKTIKPTKEEEV